MSDKCGAAVAEARRVLELADRDDSYLTYKGLCATAAPILARYVLAADAALAAWERWLKAQVDTEEDRMYAGIVKLSKEANQRLADERLAFSDAVRLTAEARGK